MSNYQSKNINNRSNFNKKTKDNFPKKDVKQGTSKKWGRYEQVPLLD
ncbi:hypothetical protein [Clostridium omnivorum]|nr:hypothetical protein [Clostridium sp. E14]